MGNSMLLMFFDKIRGDTTNNKRKLCLLGFFACLFNALHGPFIVPSTSIDPQPHQERAQVNGPKRCPSLIILPEGCPSLYHAGPEVQVYSGK